MITVVCTTNRRDSNTRKMAEYYMLQLKAMDTDCQLLDLREVSAEWIQQSSYGTNTSEFEAVVDQYVRQVSKLIFILPEYNGSFPGYLKFFMDACDHGDFRGKKVAMMGLASGRSGNVRGLDHLTGIFHYLNAEVYSRKVYLSQVQLALSTDGELVNSLLEKEIEAQLKGFIPF